MEVTSRTFKIRVFILWKQTSPTCVCMSSFWCEHEKVAEGTSQADNFEFPLVRGGGARTLCRDKILEVGVVAHLKKKSLYVSLIVGLLS